MCGTTHIVAVRRQMVNINVNILLEQSNCALVAQKKRLDSIKNAR